MWWQTFEQPPIIGVKHTMPLYELIWLFFGYSYYLKVVVAFILLLFEAFYLNYIFDKNNFLQNKSFLPAAIFVMLVSSFKDAQQLNPILCALLFVIFAFSKIIKTYRQNSASSQVFDSSLLLSIATLFYFPTIILYPIVWVSLIVIRPFFWREWVISFIGFILPYIFTFSIYFWFDKVNFFFFDKILFPANFNLADFFTNKYFFKVTIIVFCVLSFWGIVKSISKVPLSTIFARNMAVILIWCLLLSLFSFFLSPQANIVYLLCCFFPLTYYLSSLFITTKNKILSESMFLIFVAVALLNVFIN